MARKVVTLSFCLTEALKEKVTLDSARLGYPTVSAYLNELVMRGIPLTGDLDQRLQRIEEKMDRLSGNVSKNQNKVKAFLDDLYKRVYIIYKIAAYTLSRTFLAHPGQVTERDLIESNTFIQREVERYEEKHGGGKE